MYISRFSGVEGEKKEEVKLTLSLYGTSDFFRVASTTSSLALHPSAWHRLASSVTPGSRRVLRRKKKVYKIFKSTETSPIARGDKFPLTFYFRFAVFVSPRSAPPLQKERRRKVKRRDERRKTERWMYH